MKKTLKSILAFFAAAAVMLSLVPAALAATVDRMEVSLMYYGTEAPAAYRCSYTSASALEDKYERGIIIPMYVSTPGTVRINFTFEKLQKDMSVKVYTDQNCTNSPYNTSYFSVGDTTAEKYFSMTNAGTYYIKLYSNSYSADSDFENIIKMNVSEYTNSDKTIKSGQTIYYYRNSGTDKFYFKYTAAKTGKVTASLPYVYGSYLTLLNSKKKAVSEQEWISKTINGNRFSFAVKKGATYYFLVSTNGVSGGNIQSFSVKETAVKEKSGAKKSKAVSVKAKKTVKGLVAAGESKADWYKFSLKKDKKFAVSFSGEVSGLLKITIYRKNKKTYTGNFYGGSAKIGTLFGKSKKGTYYIKIARSNSLSSGTYSFKWK